MKFTIYGNPITKKNHGNIVMVKGHPIMLPSKPYQEYEKKCKEYMPKIGTINYPIILKCNYFMETKRKCDLVNLLQATCDVLVKYKILEDDNYSIITSFDGSSVDYDKDNPRAEIEIIKRENN
ncbi:MAG: RusA family crossover junction endodeoxyribonuclease [Bacteroidales bacterium]|nr:RusA family crossover junction endodeoxyribonuclease [Bacteroidales bacterium]